MSVYVDPSVYSSGAIVTIDGDTVTITDGTVWVGTPIIVTATGAITTATSISTLGSVSIPTAVAAAPITVTTTSPATSSSGSTVTAETSLQSGNLMSLNPGNLVSLNPGNLLLAGTLNVLRPIQLPAPIDGVSTLGITSLDLDRLFGAGYGFSFLGGTGTVQLTNGTLGLGAYTPLALVQRLYEGVLGRAGDPDGLGAFGRELTAGFSPTMLARQMLEGPEYAARFGTPSDEQFVTDLYRNFHHRLPDADGRANALGLLAGGLGRDELAAGFAQSTEAKYSLGDATARIWALDPAGAFVTQLYGTAYARAPDADGLAAFKGQIASGASGAFLAGEIALGAEFQALHGGQDPSALADDLYRNALGRPPSGLEATLTSQAVSAGGVAGELLRLASSPEAAAYLSPAILPLHV